MSVHKLRKPLKTRWWPRGIAVGVALVWGWIVLSPNFGGQTIEVLVAKKDFVVGEAVKPTDFEVQAIALGSASGIYSRASDITKATRIRREVHVGELVPLTSLGPAVIDRVPLAVEVNQAISSRIHAGSQVDIWATPNHLGQVDGNPETIALGATIANISTDAALGKKVTTVELWLAPAFVEPVLLAQANQSALALVLAPTLADDN